MKEYKITVEELALSLDRVNNNRSSSESDDFYTKSPRHVILYNEILRFSKEELESVMKYGKPYIWSLVVNSRSNPLWFSALIQKGAFIENLSPEAKDLLKYITPESTIEYYDFILSMQTNENETFVHEVCRFLFNLETEEKKELLEPLYLKYLNLSLPKSKKIRSDVIKFCYEHPKAKLSAYLFQQLEDNKIDINKDFPLNNYLPKEIYGKNEKYHTFFISSSYITSIKEKLEAGFIFDEKNYIYNKNETLFTAVIKSERKDIIETIVPYLSHIVPFSGHQEEQTILVENLKNKNEPIYNMVASYYYKMLMEQALPHKEVVNKRKI